MICLGYSLQWRCQTVKFRRFRLLSCEIVIESQLLLSQYEPWSGKGQDRILLLWDQGPPTDNGTIRDGRSTSRDSIPTIGAELPGTRTTDLHHPHQNYGPGIGARNCAPYLANNLGSVFMRPAPTYIRSTPCRSLLTAKRPNKFNSFAYTRPRQASKTYMHAHALNE